MAKGESDITGYNLSRKWFDFCFENPERIVPSHTALYFFIIEHCNRLGWKSKFGLPTTMAMEAIGIKSYNTYKKTLSDLIEFGFVKMVEVSKNQYSSNIVALSNFDKALNKALDKALTKHLTKQSESTVQSIDSIDKQLTINKEQGTGNGQSPAPVVYSIEHCMTVALNDPTWVMDNKATKEELETFNLFLRKRCTYQKDIRDYKNHFANWKDKRPAGQQVEIKTTKSNISAIVKQIENERK